MTFDEYALTLSYQPVETLPRNGESLPVGIVLRAEYDTVLVDLTTMQRTPHHGVEFFLIGDMLSWAAAQYGGDVSQTWEDRLSRSQDITGWAWVAEGLSA
jgi:hypothetical protein